MSAATPTVQRGATVAITAGGESFDLLDLSRHEATLLVIALRQTGTLPGLAAHLSRLLFPPVTHPGGALMRTHVQVFVAESEYDIQKAINAFLAALRACEVVDIKWAMSHETDGGYWLSALLIYREETA